MMRITAAAIALIAAGALAASALAAPGVEPVCPPVATAPTPDALMAAVRSARDRGALWTIEKDGRQSWLYGTIHIGNLEMSAPGPKVAQALRAADTIAVEVDVTDPATMQAIHASDPARMPPTPPALSDRLKAQARRACLPWEHISGIPAVMAAIALTTLDGRWDGLDPAYASELMLIGVARSTGKSLRALETAETQRGALLAVTPERQIQMLDEVLAALEQNRARPALATIARAWSAGDLATIAAYDQWCLCTVTAEDRADFERVVFDRNPGLAAAVDLLHREGRRVFAAVGIAHMVGDRGLPALMAGLGYRVQRVRFDVN